MVYKPSFGDRLFDYINYILLTLLMLSTFYPLYYVFVVSLSSIGEIAKHGSLMFFPRGFTLEAYQSVIANNYILKGFRNTVFYVVLGTSINMIMTILAAYALSRKWLMGRKVFMIIIVITMFFSGGLIPTFIVIQKLHLYNTIWALMLPGAMSAFNMIMMRTYFQGIPESLEESARIDGAHDFQILFRIILPVSMPIIAVMILFYAVGHWNSWFSASIYLQNRELFPLQLILREILIQGRISDMGGDTSNVAHQVAKNLKYATIIVSTVPILLVYPFIQKYFVKGVLLGSLKE
ncbi:putative aldouronate transport system permease protein [Paenibacillus taihuensis]|uniref:Putative aldouronate transport system permease protein n=1 Tax=Paenibacillus taihuensis TaxID=1156355 RepID=A0A3D9Q7I9_9BACL|nr:carbohydrate ABC transporter permease [Paenibacillus taihuensis]REE57574.1 putative aldouronate transport system permease protein [Paenibacillus taihuensis]